MLFCSTARALVGRDRAKARLCLALMGRIDIRSNAAALLAEVVDTLSVVDDVGCRYPWPG
jgi:hypothetical protein